MAGPPVVSAWIKLTCDATGCSEQVLVIAATAAMCGDYATAGLGWTVRRAPENKTLCYCPRHNWLGLPVEPLHPKE